MFLLSVAYCLHSAAPSYIIRYAAAAAASPSPAPRLDCSPDLLPSTVALLRRQNNLSHPTSGPSRAREQPLYLLSDLLWRHALQHLCAATEGGCHWPARTATMRPSSGFFAVLVALQACNWPAADLQPHPPPKCIYRLEAYSPVQPGPATQPCSLTLQPDPTPRVTTELPERLSLWLHQRRVLALPLLRHKAGPVCGAASCLKTGANMSPASPPSRLAALSAMRLGREPRQHHTPRLHQDVWWPRWGSHTRWRYRRRTTSTFTGLTKSTRSMLRGSAVVCCECLADASFIITYM